MIRSIPRRTLAEIHRPRRHTASLFRHVAENRSSTHRQVKFSTSVSDLVPEALKWADILVDDERREIILKLYAEQESESLHRLRRAKTARGIVVNCAALFIEFGWDWDGTKKYACAYRPGPPSLVIYLSKPLATQRRGRDHASN